MSLEAVIDTEASPVIDKPAGLPKLGKGDLDNCKKVAHILQKAEFNSVKIEDMLATHEVITWFVSRLIPYLEQEAKAG